MPRLDAERLAIWRMLTTSTARLQRAVEEALRDEFDLSLEWFEVLGALQRAGGPLRMIDLIEDLAAVPSSLTRRVDKMEVAGLVLRRRGADPKDGRAVLVADTPAGRDLWRAANIVYRRGVQNHFARHMTETDLHALVRLFGKIGHPEAPPPE